MTWSGQATLSGATLQQLVEAASETHTIFVTKITLSIITHANGKLVRIEDTADTPVVIAKHIDATAAAGVPSVVTWDFGRKGVAITEGKNLNAVSEASGVEGIVYAEGYHIS